MSYDDDAERIRRKTGVSDFEYSKFVDTETDPARMDLKKFLLPTLKKYIPEERYNIDIGSKWIDVGVSEKCIKIENKSGHKIKISLSTGSGSNSQLIYVGIDVDEKNYPEESYSVLDTEIKNMFERFYFSATDGESLHRHIRIDRTFPESGFSQESPREDVRAGANEFVRWVARLLAIYEVFLEKADEAGGFGAMLPPEKRRKRIELSRPKPFHKSDFEIERHEKSEERNGLFVSVGLVFLIAVIGMMFLVVMN